MKENTKLTNNCQRGTKCEVFSRSMGYIRPIKNFNIGKRAEFEERNTFKEANALTTGSRHCELLKHAA